MGTTLMPGASDIAQALKFYEALGFKRLPLTLPETGFGNVIDKAEALERLYLCRAADEGVQARSLYDGRADVGKLALAWRIQDPERWLGPLRPWPAGVASAHPAA